jgi:hypothetical protein
MPRSSATTSKPILGSAFSASWGGQFEQLKRFRTLLVVTLAALLMYFGWAGREGRNISAGEGLGYWLGVYGGTLMVLLLLYSVRKRFTFMRHFGPTRHWFKMHMSLGILGPVIILYHANFQVGSTNSKVALYCTLIVAASGIVGRYFYAQIHNGLYGSSSSLRQLVESVETSRQQKTHGPGLNAEVMGELAGLAQNVLVRSDTWQTSALSPIWLGLKTRKLYWQLRHRAYQDIDRFAAASAVGKQHRRRLRRTTSRYIAKRLAEIRKVAQFSFFKKLFSLWHVVHVPFFLMMVLSVLIHVLAVHMY